MTDFCLRFPRAVLALVAAISLLAAAGASQLRSEVGYRSFLGSAHPSVQRFDGFLATYGGGLPLVAVWSCREASSAPSPCKDVFEDDSLRMAFAAARAMEDVPGVRSVQSPATTAVIVDGILGIEVRRMVEFGEPVGDRSALRTAALADPLWQGLLVSEDAKAGAIVVDLGSSDSRNSVAAFAALRRALAPYEEVGFRFAFVGGPVEFVVAGPQLREDTRKLVPLMLALIGGCLYVVFGSLPLTVASLGVVGLAVLWTLGLAGWAGWPQTSIGEVLPPLVLAAGSCDVIHLLAHFRPEPDRPVREAIGTAASEVLLPCTLTSLTTAAGLASFMTSDLEAFVHFGAAAATATLLALLLTFSVLPALIAVFGIRPRKQRADRRGTQAALAALTRFASARAPAVIVATAVVLLAASFGLASLRTQSSFEQLYGEHSKVVGWANFVASELRRPDTLEIGILGNRDDAALSSEGLEVALSVASELTQLDGLGQAYSFAAAAQHYADAFGLRDDPGGAASRLRTMAGRATASWLSADGRGSRISVEAEKLEQERLEATVEAAEAIAARIPPPWRAVVTGPLAVVRDMVQAIRATQLSSFVLAFVLVFTLLAVALRSLSLATLGMVPTVLPAAVVLGAMGALGIALDAGTAMVAAVVLGVAVDDAVHLLVEQRRRVRAGANPREAMDAATMHIGTAIVTTSVALAAGFLSLCVSSWQSIADFGVLAALAIAVALLATLLVLPACVYAGFTGPGSR